jgi:hypothetical protein
MSRARTRQIESGIERQYRAKGRSVSDASYIAGAVMGNIKRERAAKRVDPECLEREYGVRQRGAGFDRRAYDAAIKACAKRGKR